jgi:ribosomal protein S18 acetylase RimI-like enzyme
MAALSDAGEIVVAEVNGEIAGAVAYIGPDKPKSSFFDIRWPVMRMLVVHPSSRGLGVGRLLTHDCIERARRDKAEVFALHTTKLMSVAVSMYERMGFILHASAPDIYGVQYGIYLKQLRNA